MDSKNNFLICYANYMVPKANTCGRKQFNFLLIKLWRTMHIQHNAPVMLHSMPREGRFWMSDYGQNWFDKL